MKGHYDQHRPGLAIGTALALIHAARTPRTLMPPTPEQLARQAKDDERADWNKAVEAKKAAALGGLADPVGAHERKAP